MDRPELMCFTLMAAALAVGCNKTEKPSGTSASASASATGSAAIAPASAAAAGAVAAVPKPNDGHVVKGKDLVMFDPPKPKGAPADGVWSQTLPVEDGFAYFYYQKKDDGWMSFDMIDCNSAKAKKYADKKPDERGNFSYCFSKPTRTLKGMPLWAEAGSEQLAVMVNGHLVVAAGAFLDRKTGKKKYTIKEVESFLESVDYDALSKI